MTDTPPPAGGPAEMPEPETPQMPTTATDVESTGMGALTGPTGSGAPVPPVTPERHGMFHTRDTGDTSGYGRLKIPPAVPKPASRPFGGYFDDVADALAAAMAERGIPESAIEQVTIGAA